MPDRTPIWSFPGVQQIVGVSGTFTHGITPSTFMLTTAPQDNFAGDAGDLVMSDGVAQLRIVDCKVDRHTFEDTGAGRIWKLQVFDRRWKWQWGKIAGFYNRRNDDGTLKTDANNVQTPQQLASLLFNAMGESGFDVSALPNDARPLTQWDGDVPAEALADLAHDLGCRVILRLDNTAAIEIQGEGDELPEDDTMIENSLTIDPPEQPDAIGVLCGRDRYGCDFLLEAVGLDTDGTIKPINDLSYTPAAGWSTVDLPLMMAIPQNVRELAKSCIWKWYRIRTPVLVPDYGQVQTLDQLLPIEDVEIAGSAFNSVPAQVYGVFCSLTDLWRNGIVFSQINPITFQGTPGEFKKPFTIDRDLGIVKFGDFCFQNTLDTGANPPSGFQTGPATLRLRVAVSVKDPSTFAPFRHTRVRSYGNNYNTQPRYLHHDEAVLIHQPTYSNDTNFNVVSVVTNQADVDGQCDDFIDAAEQDYQTTYPQTIKYAGLRQDIEMDGSVMQMSIDMGMDGCTMTVSRNDELLHRAPSYAEDRLKQMMRTAGKLFNWMKPAVLRQNIKAIARK